jgi:ATP-dependent Clp protease adaptor protein ClpS
MQGKMSLMSDLLMKPRPKQRAQVERPRLYKVILLSDDFTPREFVVTVLKAVFGMNEDQAYRVMIAAHKRDSCVVAVYTRDRRSRRSRVGGR